MDIESGTYTNTQTISLIANDQPDYFADVTYMQDMTKAICTNQKTYDNLDAPTKDDIETPRKQLIDRRDNKKYWIAKLADGNCWMTQNLALDLSTSTTLTPADTDVSTDWTPANSTTNIATVGDTDNTSIQSWSWGDYVINSPNAGTNLCSNFVANLQSCSGFASLTNVGSGTPYANNATFVATKADKTNSTKTIASDTQGTDIVSLDAANYTYDAHYLLGNYYSWNAATAGTGGTITNANATGSICPKGWHLPTSNNTDPGSFEHLLDMTYGKTTGSTINPAPLYFAFSGYTLQGLHTSYALGLTSVGSIGRYWSSTTHSTIVSRAHLLHISKTYFNPSNYYSVGGYDRCDGLSVRCRL